MSEHVGHSVQPLQARGCGGSRLLSWKLLKKCWSVFDIFAMGFSGKSMGDVVSLVMVRLTMTLSEDEPILNERLCMSEGGTGVSPTSRLPPNNLNSFWSLLS